MESKKCLLSMILFGVLPLNVFKVIRISAETKSPKYQTKFIIFKNPYHKVKEVYRVEKKGKLTFLGMKPLLNSKPKSFSMITYGRNFIEK